MDEILERVNKEIGFFSFGEEKLGLQISCPFLGEGGKPGSFMNPPVLELATMAWKWIRISLNSWIVVLMVMVQKQNPTSLCCKLYGPCLNFFGTERKHSRVPGIKWEALFLDLHVFFVMSADHRLVQIHTNLYYEFTYIIIYK